MFNYEKGDVVKYGSSMGEWLNNLSASGPVGLIVDVEYHVKPDDFLIFIMWSDANRPQALFQKDCHDRGLRVLD